MNVITDEIKKLNAEHEKALDIVNKELDRLRKMAEGRETEVKAGREAESERQEEIKKRNDRIDQLERALENIDKKYAKLQDAKIKGEDPNVEPKSMAKAIKGLAGFGWDSESDKKSIFVPGADGRTRAMSLYDYEQKARLVDETSTSYGNYIVPEEYSRDFLDTLWANAVMSKLGLKLYTPTAGKINISALTSGTTGYWVGSGDAITHSAPVFGRHNLEPHDAAVLTAVTNDLLRRSDPSVDQIIRDNLLNVMSNLIEIAFLQGSGSSEEPEGVYTNSSINEVDFGAGSGAKPSAATSLDKLHDCIKAIENNNGNPSAWIMHPRTKNDFRTIKTSYDQYVLTMQNNAGDPPLLLGLPYYTTTNLSAAVTKGGTSNTSSILLADWAKIYFAMWDSIRIETSNQASYAVSGTNYHGFQRDETVIRATTAVDFLVPYPTTVCKLTGIMDNDA